VKARWSPQIHFDGPEGHSAIARVAGVRNGLTS